MKPQSTIQSLALCATVALGINVQAAPVTKEATGTDLADGASWGGSAPTASDTAIWESSSLGAGLTLGTPASWGGIKINDALSDIDISGIGTLTIGAGGIDASSSSRALSIGNVIVMDGSQTWTAGTDLSSTVAIVGTGTLTLDGVSATVLSDSTFLTGTHQTIFTAAELGGLTLTDLAATGGLMGGAWVNSGVPLPATGYYLSNDGTTATYWLETVDLGGTDYTKGVEIELVQSGSDITAKGIRSKYLPGTTLPVDFDTAGNNGTLATSQGGNGYGGHTTTATFGADTTITLSGNNTYDGGTVVDGGLVIAGTGVAAGATQGGSFSTGDITINAGATVMTTGFRVLGGGDQTTRTVNINGGTANIEGGGTGGEYLRTLNMTGGTLEADSGTVYYRTSKTGADINSLAAADSSTISTGIDMTYSSIVLDVADGAAADDLVISGIISEITGAGSGAKSLTKNGAGTLRLAGANSFTGGVTVNAGVLELGHLNAFGAYLTGQPVDQVTVAAGAAVDFTGVPDAIYGYTIAADGVGGTGVLTNSGAAIPNNKRQCSNILLSGDASIGGSGNWSLLTSSYAPTTLDLAGNTLSKVGANTIALVSTTVTAGTIQVSDGAMTLGITNGGSGVNAPDTALVLDDVSGLSVSVIRNSSIGSLEGTGTVGGDLTLDGATLTVGALNTSTTYGGLIDGTGGLTKTGTGTLTLANDHNYSGPTTVAAGTLALAASDSIAGSDVITVQAGAEISATELAIENAQTLAGEGSITGDLTFLGGAILSAEGLTAGSLSTTGALTVSGGTVEVIPTSAPAAGGAFDILGFGSYSGTAATDFTLSGTVTVRAGYVFSSTMDHVQLALNSENKTWSNALADGVWDAATSGNWSGGTDMLFYDFDSVTFGDTGAGAVTLDSSLSAGDVSFSNTLGNDYTLSSNSLTIGGTLAVTGAGDVTIESGLAGPGAVAKSGTGTLTLSGSNSYSGGTTVDGGSLVAAAASALGSGDVTVNSGSLVATASNALGGGDVTVNGGSLSTTAGNGFGSGAIMLGATADDVSLYLANRADVGNDITVSAAGTGTVIIGANNTGSGANAAAHSGTITLNRATTFSGEVTDDRLAIDGQITGNVGTLTVSGGARTTFRSIDNDFVGDLVVTGAGTMLQASVASAAEVIPDGTDVTVEADAIIQLATAGNGTETIDALNGAGTVRTYVGGGYPGVLAVGSADGSGSFSGVLEDGTGALSLTKTGTGTQVLSGPSTYSGNTTVDDGTLEVTGSLDGGTSITVTTPGILELGDGSVGDDCWILFQPTADTVSNTISGDGTVTLNDAIDIDLSVADLTDGSRWLLVDVGTLSVTYGANFEVIGFTESSPGVWTTSAWGNNWTFTEATGLLETEEGAGYDAWAATNAPGQTMDMDHDGDGTENGIEYFMGESGNGFTAHPVLDATNTVSYPKGGAYSGVYGTDYVVQTSTDLSVWTDVTSGDPNLNDGDPVEYTLPTGSGKLFVRLKVTGP